MEESRPIVSHPNYRVTRTGRVVNKHSHEKALDAHSKDGYLKVNLYKGGKGSSKRVHHTLHNFA